MSDNKSFWMSVKPYFSTKGLSSNKVTLVENDAINTKGRVISKTMKKFFIKATIELNLKSFKNSSETDINQITSAFKNYVSIRKIQECFQNIEANGFNFRQASLKKIKSVIINRNIKT